MTKNETSPSERPDSTTSSNPRPAGDLELLAPAGDPASLRAAIDAGADAVYFGLTVLNARRRARNFAEDELDQAVQDVHRAGARAYLTLNTDLAERELDLAARVLERARRAGVDAVLVRDPALLALRDEYPELEFHFSTQTCVTNSADVTAASVLGATRVVLARELTLSEIAAASAVPGIQTEVFAQGALCFSVSGRCLMSSWVGGRSGNRGACTSPCRVPWSVDGEPAGTPLSMHDLATIDRLDDLSRAGVTALKIEGRMKKPAWVREAVAAYRRAISGERSALLTEEIQRLGDYTGRHMTSAYLDGQRDALTGESGRRRVAGGIPDAGTDSSADSKSAAHTSTDLSTYDFDLTIEPRGIQCRCECGGLIDTWSIPKTVVRRPKKATSIEMFFARLSVQPLAGCRPNRTTTNDPEFLLVPRAVNGLMTRISKIIQRSQKKRRQATQIDLPEPVLAILEKRPRCPSSRTCLGNEPDRVRLDCIAVEPFVAGVRPGGVIVEGLTPDDLKSVRAACGRIPLIAALPSVFFEEDIPRLRKLLTACRRANVTVEVNSWGGWHLAREARVRVESGPGLSALNSVAARMLGKLGMRSVTLSPEADRRKLEDVAASCPVPCSLVVFGRPPLMITRVELPEDDLGKTLTDRRDTRVTVRQEGGLWVVRPIQPFDLRDVQNERLLVKHLVVDLVGSPNPHRDWQSQTSRRKSVFRFNYDRRLH